MTQHDPLVRQVDPERNLVITFLGLRRAVGLLGISLPFVLAVGDVAVKGWVIEPSISDYYYTAMRNVLVGALWAIGVFLTSYRGYDRRDDVIADVAGLAVVCVSLFPAVPLHDPTTRQRVVGDLHLAFAAVFFASIAYFALFLFTRSDGPPTARKLQRNRLYRACGWTILGCLALILLSALFPPGSAVQRLQPAFWLESVAVLAFGLSWLVKGQTLLADQPPAGPAPEPPPSRT